MNQDKQKGLAHSSLTENENINLYPIVEPTTFWDKYNPARIPCFRDSLLYGLGSGIGVTLFTTVLTQNARKS
eukprot:gene7904-9280_t